MIIEKALGPYIYVDGCRLLDFTSGVILANAGHANPYVQTAVRRILDKPLMFAYGFEFEEKLSLRRRLRNLFTPHYYAAEFTTTGAEAIEVVLRMSLRAGQTCSKPAVGTFEGAFHGKTAGAASIGTISRYRLAGTKIQAPLVEFEFPNEESSGRVLGAIASESGRLSAIFLELVQGSTLRKMPPPFVSQLATLCREKHILLVIDEIQTGFFRVGPRLLSDEYRIRPDILLLGKALTSSLPLAAIVVQSKDVHNYYDRALDSSTHAANPLAIAAALGCLDFYESQDFKRVSSESANAFRDSIATMDLPEGVATIVPGGHIAGFFFESLPGQAIRKRVADFRSAALSRGLFVPKAVGVRENLVKLTPPLITPAAELTTAIEGLSRALCGIEASSHRAPVRCD